MHTQALHIDLLSIYLVIGVLGTVVDMYYMWDPYTGVYMYLT